MKRFAGQILLTDRSLETLL